jgi:hypothetical protein
MRALSQEERRRLGAGKPPGLGHDALEHGRQLPLAADRDPELEQILDHLGAAVGGRAHEPQEARIPHVRSGDVHDRGGIARAMPALGVLEIAEIPVRVRGPARIDRSEPVNF